MWKGISIVLVASCFLAVQGVPKPDQDVRFNRENAKPAPSLETTTATTTTSGRPEIEDGLEEAVITTTPATDKTSRFWERGETPQGTVDNRTKLLADLLTKYNKRVNPDHVKLDFGVNLIDFRVKEDRNVLESYVWLRLSWEDHRLRWNPADYGGVEVLRVDSNAVWLPDITLYNSADPVNMINCWETNTVIFPQGKIIYIPPCKMTSQCSFSLRKFPYGNQECSMKFGSWTFDGNVLDVQFYNGTKGVDLSQLVNSSGFEVVSTTGERNVKFYPCCPDPYPDLTFNVTIKRVPAEELFYRLQ